MLDAEYLRHVIARVHLNPVAARMVGDPLDHPASGRSELLGLRAPVLCDVGAALLSYDEESKIARQIYQERQETNQLSWSGILSSPRSTTTE